jgi:hypothetical protein
LTQEDKVANKICDISGEDLLALPLSAPLAIYPTVYTLPMMSIKMDKVKITKYLKKKKNYED